MMKPANNAPIYACIYAEFAEIFRENGYALAIHGSLARDFDLIAVPWVEKPTDHSVILERLDKEFGAKSHISTAKLHDRVVYTLVFCGGTTFIDLSFMPTQCMPKAMILVSVALTMHTTSSSNVSEVTMWMDYHSKLGTTGELEKHLRDGVKEGKWVGWRLLRIVNQEIE